MTIAPSEIEKLKAMGYYIEDIGYTTDGKNHFDGNWQAMLGGMFVGYGQGLNTTQEMAWEEALQFQQSKNLEAAQ